MVKKYASRRNAKRRQPMLSKLQLQTQKRNSEIFRLRGYYANAKTLPFTEAELNQIIILVNQALIRLEADPLKIDKEA